MVAATARHAAAATPPTVAVAKTTRLMVRTEAGHCWHAMLTEYSCERAEHVLIVSGVADPLKHAMQTSPTLLTQLATTLRHVLMPGHPVAIEFK